jgi:hypothetical protein
MSTSNAEEIIEAGYATPIYVDGLAHLIQPVWNLS